MGFLCVNPQYIFEYLYKSEKKTFQIYNVVHNIILFSIKTITTQ